MTVLLSLDAHTRVLVTSADLSQSINKTEHWLCTLNLNTKATVNKIEGRGAI